MEQNCSSLDGSENGNMVMNQSGNGSNSARGSVGGVINQQVSVLAGAPGCHAPNFPGNSPAPMVEIKLFVGRVPPTMDENGLKPIFEEYGEVKEVVIIRDKQSSKHKNSAFVKMGSIAHADAAIRGLNNIRILDGTMGAVTVKYATGEAEKLGLSSSAIEAGVDQAKLFIGSIPKTLNEEGIRAFFTKYGNVEEVFVMKDNVTNQGRGCAFVKFSYKEEALHAINSLNSKHKFDGCNRPVEVRFAESRAQRQQQQSQHYGSRENSSNQMNNHQPMNRNNMSGGSQHNNMRGQQQQHHMMMNNNNAASNTMGLQQNNSIQHSNNNPRQAGRWKEYFTQDGRAYYHNELTGVTTWERPQEFYNFAPPAPPSQMTNHQGGNLGGSSSAHQHSSPHHNMNNNTTNMQHQNNLSSSGSHQQHISGGGGSSSAGSQHMMMHQDSMNNNNDSAGPPGANIFVFHVPNEWTYYDLVSNFSMFGSILSARVATDRQTGRNRGFAFVSYDNMESAAHAVNSMNGFMANGKRLKVTIKKGEEQYVQHLLQNSQSIMHNNNGGNNANINNSNNNPNNNSNNNATNGSSNNNSSSNSNSSSSSNRNNNLSSSSTSQWQTSYGPGGGYAVGGAQRFAPY